MQAGASAFPENVIFYELRNGEPLLVFGSRQHNLDQIALLMRSVREILTEFSAGVEAPERDLAEGRAAPMRRPGAAS